MKTFELKQGLHDCIDRPLKVIAFVNVSSKKEEEKCRPMFTPISDIHAI